MIHFTTGLLLLVMLCSCGLRGSGVVIEHKPLVGNTKLVIYHKTGFGGWALHLPIYVNGERVPGKVKMGSYLTCHVPAGNCVVSTHAANSELYAAGAAVNGMANGLVAVGIKGLAIGAAAGSMAAGSGSKDDGRFHKPGEDTEFMVASGETYYVEIHNQFKMLGGQLSASVRSTSQGKAEIADCKDLTP